jgi:pyrroline-5-carboxylate reductase
MNSTARIAILGAGSLGTSIADGLVESGQVTPGDLTLTRRRVEVLEPYRQRGFRTGRDNVEAVVPSNLVIVAVEPQQLDPLLDEIAGALDSARHVLVSVVTGATIERIEARLDQELPLVRAMPNTAVAVRESMTCLAGNDRAEAALDQAEKVFGAVGKTLRIPEEDMTAATALGACGVAFFLRAIRAASQGGIEIGFHSADAFAIAAQTARGAASLLLSEGKHPEQEIDKVTTPRGCTIAGLNQMEHEGFSSAMIKGITVSARKAAGLYPDDDER